MTEDTVTGSLTCALCGLGAKPPEPGEECALCKRVRPTEDDYRWARIKCYSLIVFGLISVAALCVTLYPFTLAIWDMIHDTLR